MPGPIVLVGSGEFTVAMEEVDRDLLAATGRARPRVAIVPTASWPDGNASFLRWIEQGRAHFSALGAEVEGVELRTGRMPSTTCAQAIGEPTWSHLSGGKPDHLLALLDGTPAGAALRAVHLRGSIVAGCSAGRWSSRPPAACAATLRRFPTGWRDAPGPSRGSPCSAHDAFRSLAAAAVVLTVPSRTVVPASTRRRSQRRDGTGWDLGGTAAARVTVSSAGRSRTRHPRRRGFRLGG
jgi:hypothetical protein